MSTTNSRVADHMQIAPAYLQSSAQATQLDGQVTKTVSMLNANKVTVTTTILVALPNDRLDVIIEGSNDESNWFELGREPHTTGGNFTSGTRMVDVDGVGMAWVRVVFLLDNATQGVGDKTSINSDLTTTLA